jgi:hypothetical protein
MSEEFQQLNLNEMIDLQVNQENTIYSPKLPELEIVIIQNFYDREYGFQVFETLLADVNWRKEKYFCMERKWICQD